MPDKSGYVASHLQGYQGVTKKGALISASSRYLCEYTCDVIPYSGC